MTISPATGKRASKDVLGDVRRLEREYFSRKPDPEDPGPRRLRHQRPGGGGIVNDALAGGGA